MAYDEPLAGRIREIVADIDGEITERKMFGGLAFMLNGHMFAGIVGAELMLRLGEAGAEAALDTRSASSVLGSLTVSLRSDALDLVLTFGIEFGFA